MNSHPRHTSNAATEGQVAEWRLYTARNVFCAPAGSPCFASSVVLPADLEQGCPLYDVGAVGEQTWRAARVLPYEVPPSLLGHGEGGQRPFHQVRPGLT